MKAIYKLAATFAAIMFLVPVHANAQERFIDNSFASIGAGVNATILHPLHPKTWGNVGLATELSIGKWWNSYVGTRLGLNGGWNNSSETLTILDVPASTPFGFRYYHADVLVQASNMLFGVNEKRLWEGVLYANVGALKLCKNRTLFGEGISKWALGAGMINEFKVCKEASIVVDMEAIAVKARAFSTTAGRLAIFPTITVGLSYNLGEIF